MDLDDIQDGEVYAVEESKHGDGTTARLRRGRRRDRHWGTGGLVEATRSPSSSTRQLGDPQVTRRRLPCPTTYSRARSCRS